MDRCIMVRCPTMSNIHMATLRTPPYSIWSEDALERLNRRVCGFWLSKKVSQNNKSNLFFLQFIIQITYYLFLPTPGAKKFRLCQNSIAESEVFVIIFQIWVCLRPSGPDAASEVHKRHGKRLYALRWWANLYFSLSRVIDECSMVPDRVIGPDLPSGSVSALQCGG